MFSNAALHVIPLDDEVLHFASGKCPCQPFCDDRAEMDIYVHHAADGREAAERAGKPVDGKGWTNVGEWLNDQ